MAHLVAEKYEDISLLKGVADLSLENHVEETKVDTPEEMVIKLKKDKNLILNSKMQVVEPP